MNIFGESANSSWNLCMKSAVLIFVQKWMTEAQCKIVEITPHHLDLEWFFEFRPPLNLNSWQGLVSHTWRLLFYVWPFQMLSVPSSRFTAIFGIPISNTILIKTDFTFYLLLFTSHTHKCEFMLDLRRRFMPQSKKFKTWILSKVSLNCK